jgi:CheY-like chemotaxis protein
MPTSDPDKSYPAPSVEFVAHATSELNNLLQIIAGSSSALEKASGGDDAAAEYLQMLRASVNRAEVLGQELAKSSGGAAEKAICNSAVAAFLKNRKTGQPSTARQTIMVVDDEKMALTLMERFLRDADYDVVVAQSGFDCLELFRKEPYRFALVLLDFSLPFMDGAETFRRLREIRNNVPVVLCTGFILQDRLSEMINAGLTGFLRKPVPPDELLSVVRSTLQSAMYSRDTTDAGGMSLVS